MPMSRFCYVVFCGLGMGLGLAVGAEPPVVGDPTGAFRKELESIWVRGDPKAADRVELEFSWQRIGRRAAGLADEGPAWVKRPAISLTTYRKGEVVHSQYGAVFLEKKGKHLLKWGARMYEYELKDDILRLKEYTAPFQFDEPDEEKPRDEDALSGEWKKQDSSQKRERNK
jgi:hypothetical protein